MVESKEVGKVEGELVPRRSYDYVARCVSYMVVDMGVGVVDTVEDMEVVGVGRVVDTEEDREVGTVGVVVGDSMVVGKMVRTLLHKLERISLILGLI